MAYFTRILKEGTKCGCGSKEVLSIKMIIISGHSQQICCGNGKCDQHSILKSAQHAKWQDLIYNCHLVSGTSLMLEEPCYLQTC